jgi:aryl carrier-like protein
VVCVLSKETVTNVLNPSAPGLDDSDPETSDLRGEMSHEERVDWLRRSTLAYRASTTYVDSNYRKKWNDSIAAFNSQHPSDSKYQSAAFEKRSKIYRPKTRSIIRKNEAAAATAFFSNMDVVSIQAENQGDPKEIASAEVMKAILQYRLTKSIPWFQVVVGGLQDAQKTGAVVARVDWEYNEKHKLVDRPRVTLIPVENIRVDPASDWRDPINTSPYVIELIPMWVGDVKAMMNKVDKKTGQPKWRKIPDSVLKQARTVDDATRSTRNQQRQDQYQSDTPISDYETCWIQRHIHRKDGEDWLFYTVGEEALLTDPEPLVESVWTGERDYVMGCCILETHIVFPSSVSDLIREQQTEANEIVNQRLDNVKLVMNKKYFAKRGKNVDFASLLRNVPGSITLMDDVDSDVRVVDHQDVTSSSYQEQDRLNADIDELAGNFSAQSLTPQMMANAPAKTMTMLAAPANGLVEFLLRTYVETFIEPVLRKLVKLEQHYETDNVILSLAGQQAKIFQRYGIDRVTDELLNAELSVKVNVGMGATDPQMKLMKFVAGVGAYSDIVMKKIPGLNTNEIGKEIFGHLGYQDGRRFMTTDDPEKEQMQMQIMQLSKLLQDKTAELQTKKYKVDMDNATKLKVAGVKEDGENKRTLATHISTMAREGLKGETVQALHTPGPDMQLPDPAGQQEQHAKAKLQAQSQPQVQPQAH